MAQDEIGRGRPGVGLMRELLLERDAGVPDSGFERRVLRMITNAGLPWPVQQHEVRTGGRRVATVDLAYPELRLAIAADGYRWHSGKVRWQRDRRRSNALMLMGWRIIHVTLDDVTQRPDAVISAIQ